MIELLRWTCGGAAAFVLGATVAVFSAARITWRRPIVWHVRLVVLGNSAIVFAVLARVLGSPASVELALVVLVGLLLELAALVVMFHAATHGDRRVRRSTDAPAAAGAAMRLELEHLAELDPTAPVAEALELADQAAAIAVRHVDDLRAE